MEKAAAIARKKLAMADEKVFDFYKKDKRHNRIKGCVACFLK